MKAQVGVQGGSTPPAAPEAAALTKADAERILASYWQVNNTANESRSDTLLKTVGGGVLAFYALTAQLTPAPLPGQTRGQHGQHDRPG